MATVDTIVRTITCNGPACEKTATFTQQNQQETIDQNLWLKTYRNVTTFDGRSLGYCSDVCEVEGIKAGTHVPPQQKVIQMPTGDAMAAIRAAAAQSAANAEGTRALKEGGIPAGGIVQGS